MYVLQGEGEKKRKIKVSRGEDGSDEHGYTPPFRSLLLPVYLLMMLGHRFRRASREEKGGMQGRKSPWYRILLLWLELPIYRELT